MKRFFVVLMGMVFLAGCATTTPQKTIRIPGRVLQQSTARANGRRRKINLDQAGS